MTKIAFFDCFSGCSGDMLLGALLDTGLPLDELKQGLSSLEIGSYQIKLERVLRSSLSASRFIVETDSRPSHPRCLADILGTIERSQLPPKVKNTSSKIFQRLGEVEAAIHNQPLNNVHFHEIGAVDSIIDIVGTIFALDFLKVERFYASPLPLGDGSISTSHGLLPVPAPATLQLLAMAKAPIVNSQISSESLGELVTPTGAAVITSLAEFRRPDMNLSRIGYGAGTRDLKDRPNVLRIWLGEEIETTEKEDLILLETNIDDMNPQIYSYLMEKLFSEKALDVWLTPIQMKKNRPAVMLDVLAPVQLESRLTEIILKETTTLGIRVRPVSRHAAQRETIEFDSSLGHIRAKVKRFSGQILDVSPEYEDCRRIAQERDIPLREVYRIINTEIRK
jgi:pyridinium-3,5-bisthiocarboxylic acid mononucleotide nickel chelatase